MIFLFFLFVVGYGTGWAIQKIIAHVRPPMGQCNIGKRGISSRSWLAIILVLIGFYFELPIITFFAGFTWYESRAKWCITQSVMQ